VRATARRVFTHGYFETCPRLRLGHGTHQLHPSIEVCQSTTLYIWFAKIIVARMARRFSGGGHEWTVDSCSPRLKPWATQSLDSSAPRPLDPFGRDQRPRQGGRGSSVGCLSIQVMEAIKLKKDNRGLTRSGHGRDAHTSRAALAILRIVHLRGMAR